MTHFSWKFIIYGSFKVIDGVWGEPAGTAAVKERTQINLL